MPKDTSKSEVSLRIQGMHCAGCVSTVEKALKKVQGVRDATVNLTTERAKVILAPDSTNNTDAMLKAVSQAGYKASVSGKEGEKEDAHHGHEHAQQIRGRIIRLVVAAVLGLPVILPHFLPTSWVGGPHLSLPVLIAQAVLTLAVFAIAAGEMITGALRAAARLRADMDLLVTLGAGVSFLAGILGIILSSHELIVFDSAVLIVLFVGIGKYLEANARGRASQALETLHGRMPKKALRVVDSRVEEVSVDEVQTGDTLRLKPHAQVPVDGTITSGRVSIDESMLTGESMPADRGVDENVFGGTQVLSGTAELRATATGAESAAARIAELVDEAQAGKTPWQRLADRVAGVFVPVVLAIAAATFFGWLVAGGDAYWALHRAIAVLVVACPCAMGLAIPTAVAVATGRAAQRGILVRDAAALEATAGLKEMLLDKTGTLTRGRPQVERLETLSSHDEEEVLRSAAALAQLSDHPLSRAILERARQALHAEGARRDDAEAGGARGADRDEVDRKATGREAAETSDSERKGDWLPPAAEDFESEPGEGLAGRLNGRSIRLGNAKWVGVDGNAKSHFAEESRPSKESRASDAARDGSRSATASSEDGSSSMDGTSVVWLSIDEKPAAKFLLRDALHPEAGEALKRLRELGLQTRILSGDRREAVAALAEELGVSEYEAELTPQRKLELVEQRAGRGVAMVGDGVNDAPALAAADVGIAIGAGTDAAREAADICLVGHSPRLIAEAVQLARDGTAIMRQNLAWAFGYNLLMLPVAIFTPLPAAAAAAAMMLSSLSVVGNSLRLRYLS